MRGAIYRGVAQAFEQIFGHVAFQPACHGSQISGRADQFCPANQMLCIDRPLATEGCEHDHHEDQRFALADRVSDPALEFAIVLRQDLGHMLDGRPAQAALIDKVD